MKYKIKVKGYPDMLTLNNGDAIRKQWEALQMKTGIDKPVNINGFIGMLSDIRSFLEVPNDAKPDGFKVVDREYEQDRVLVLSLPAKDRVRHKTVLAYLKFVVGVFGGSMEMIKPHWKQLEQDIISWYEQNTKRVYFNPTILKSILAGNKVHAHGLHIIEGVLKTDIEHAQYNK